MKEKEYPMPDDHKKLLADLLELVARRDKCAANLKYVAPELREELRKEIAQSRQIDRTGRSVIGA